MKHVHNAWQIEDVPFRIMLILESCLYLNQFQNHGISKVSYKSAVFETPIIWAIGVPRTSIGHNLEMERA